MSVSDKQNSKKETTDTERNRKDRVRNNDRDRDRNCLDLSLKQVYVFTNRIIFLKHLGENVEKICCSGNKGTMKLMENVVVCLNYARTNCLTYNYIK